jgi:hypothetical protein
MSEKDTKRSAIQDLSGIYQVALEELIAFFKKELRDTGMAIPFSDERLLQIYLEARADPALAAILTEMFPEDTFAAFVDKMEGKLAATKMLVGQGV